MAIKLKFTSRILVSVHGHRPMNGSASSAAQPVLSIPHGGGPCFFMVWEPADTWTGMADFLTQAAASLAARPKAILVISAHWQSDTLRVTSAAAPSLLYDYYGFPAHTYALQYPAAGEPDLARQITARLTEAGHPTVLDSERGFDHGVFVPLKLMFPEADIPVVQLSLQRDLNPETHLAIGQALAPLREQGVLIIASGMSFHNMAGYGNPAFTEPSQAFDSWLTEAVTASPQFRHDSLCQWQQAPMRISATPSVQKNTCYR